MLILDIIQNINPNGLQKLFLFLFALACGFIEITAIGDGEYLIGPMILIAISIMLALKKDRS